MQCGLEAYYRIGAASGWCVSLLDFLRWNRRYIKDDFPTQEQYQLNSLVIMNAIEYFDSRELSSEETKVLNFFKQCTSSLTLIKCRYSSI